MFEILQLVGSSCLRTDFCCSLVSEYHSRVIGWESLVVLRMKLCDIVFHWKRLSKKNIKAFIFPIPFFTTVHFLFRVSPRLGTAGEEDFDVTVKYVTFQTGETGPKFVDIGLVDDTDDEPTEKFTLFLSSNSRVILGGPSAVNIIDNDGN